MAQLAVLSIVCVVACDDEPQEAEGRACRPNDSQACFCRDTSQSVQTCESDGSGWSVCACPENFDAGMDSDPGSDAADVGSDDIDHGEDVDDTGADVRDAGSAGGTVRAEVWADNWFAMYIGDELIAEDSVPITTERSFNAETFTFDVTWPATLSFVLKDFKENDSGLEYIGSQRQQMGDGGFIFQLTDVDSGDVVAVSDTDWRCLVVHKAPLNKECEGDAEPLETCERQILEEPDGWRLPGFDDSGWQPASAFSEAQVSPKEGYDEIQWSANAQLIWGSDLESDNTILCRTTVGSHR